MILSAPAKRDGAAGRDWTMSKAFQALWRDTRRALFSDYRPERHYMRGPGPACAKRMAAG